MLIDGRHACLDTLGNTMLATIPERLFGGDATLPVNAEQGWTVNAIDDVTFADAGSQNSGSEPSFTFRNISAESKWVVRTTSPDGETRNDTLQFTFLPLIQLVGDFGYNYVQGTFVFSHPDSATTESFAARIKWRGGTTNAKSKHKRNYKINFDEDHRFFGLRNDDKWMLDAGQPDVFRMRNRIAMDLWHDMASKPYYAEQEPKALNSVRGALVEVFLGNEWRGVYNFSEMMDRKQLKLKKTDDKTGEIHGCLYKAVSYNKTNLLLPLEGYDNSKDTFLGFEMKYPDLDDSDTVDWRPLADVVNTVIGFNKKEFTEHINEYFDVSVMRDMSLFYSVVNASDNIGKNTYWAVYDKAAGKCLTPAPWDLDATFGQRWGHVIAEEYYSPECTTDIDVMPFIYLYKYNCYDFNGQLNSRYKAMRQQGQVFDTDSLISRVTKYYKAMKNSGAAKREETKWSGDSDVWGDVIDFDAEYEYICDWITKHMALLDSTTFPLYFTKEFFDAIDAQSIESLTQTQDGPSAIYNLSGQRIGQEPPCPERQLRQPHLRPGIYIMNGKKIVIR